ncbi:hypothetical protein DSO57_1033049 [Entomophthora muscae]|uniref:Uncharacterized protein n=1 Tax=Entomophthora muscae TaxID=34485 RepID=A0ACC2TM41_9FUNG|nr:hypothetical protein DSO57_1033049 [Entomophthora muscae]
MPFPGGLMASYYETKASTVAAGLTEDWSNPNWYWICSSTQLMHSAGAWEPAGSFLWLELVAT